MVNAYALAPPGPKERFLAFLTGTRPGDRRPIAALSTPQLLDLQGKTAELCARTQAPQFTDKVRAELQGKRSQVLGDALQLCGIGLAAREAFAKKMGFDQAGAYGWFLVSTVCDGLRDEAKRLGPKDAEALLWPFAPLLVLIGQVMEERDALGKQSRKEAAALAAAVEEARAEREDAEAALRLRGVPKDVPRETLSKLAQRSASPPAAKKGGRRTRR